jgi:hypothetical protein
MLSTNIQTVQREEVSTELVKRVYLVDETNSTFYRALKSVHGLFFIPSQKDWDGGWRQINQKYWRVIELPGLVDYAALCSMDTHKINTFWTHIMRKEKGIK